MSRAAHQARGEVQVVAWLDPSAADALLYLLKQSGLDELPSRTSIVRWALRRAATDFGWEPKKKYST
jgi:hypothetical protein